jgi:hypothetical protein
METAGRIRVNGRDRGAAFAVTPRLVLTARHCVKETDNASLLFAVDGMEITAEHIEDDERLDVALLGLSADAPSTLTIGRAVVNEGWRVESRPRASDPMLTGTITADRWRTENRGGHEVWVIQMLVGQLLDQHDGYSGSPVTSPPGTSSVVGVLVEQVLSRKPALPGEMALASNVLFAVPIEDVDARFGLRDRGVIISPPSDGAGAGPQRATVERVSGLRVAGAVEDWRDREDLVVELRRVLLDGERHLISIVGRRGIGKSAVVAKVLAEFESPDSGRDPSRDLGPLVFLSCRRGRVTLASVYQAVAAVWGPDTGKELAARWQSAGLAGLADLWEQLRGHRPVIVLDNLDDLQQPMTHTLCDPELEALLESACCTKHNPTIVTTSQHPLSLHPDLAASVRVIELSDGLRGDDAIALIRASAPRGADRLASIPDASLAAAAARVDGHPRGLQKLALMLDRRPTKIHRLLDSDALPQEVVETLVVTTYEAMSPADQLLMQVLALAAVPLSVEEVAHLLNGMSDRRDVETALERLIDAGEVNQPVDGLLELHPLDADHVRRLVLKDDRGRQVILDARLAEWWASRRKPHDCWRTLNDTIPSKREYFHRWRAGERAAALAVMADASDLLSRWGERDIVAAAVRLASSEAHSMDALGSFYACVCDARLKFYVDLDASLAALRDARAKARRAGLLKAITNLDLWTGAAHRQRNDPDSAIEVLVPIADAAADAPVTRLERQNALFDLGLSLLYANQRDRAAQIARRLEALVQPGDSAYSHAMCSNLRALAAIASRDYETAEAAATAAISHWDQTPYWDDRGYMTNVKGLALLARGETHAAVTVLQGAVADASENHRARVLGFCATNLAWAHLYASDYDAATLAAELASDRLASQGVMIAAAPRALADEIRSGRGRPRDEIRAALAHASDLAAGNPDIHLPSDAFLDAASEALAAAPMPAAGSA